MTMILNNDVLGIIYEFLVIKKCMNCNRKKQLYESYLDHEMIQMKPVYCNKCYRGIEHSTMIGDIEHYADRNILTKRGKAIPLYFSKIHWLRWLNPNDKRGVICENQLYYYWTFHTHIPNERIKDKNIYY